MIGLRLLTAWLLAVGTVVFNAPAWAASDFVVTSAGDGESRSSGRQDGSEHACRC